MNWTERKGTTGKIEPSKEFVLEEKLTSQKKISGVIFEHDIPKELQWNLSKADTYGTEVSVRFREVSTLERFELKTSQI